MFKKYKNLNLRFNTLKNIKTNLKIKNLLTL